MEWVVQNVGCPGRGSLGLSLQPQQTLQRLTLDRSPRTCAYHRGALSAENFKVIRTAKKSVDFIILCHQT